MYELRPFFNDNNKHSRSLLQLYILHICLLLFLQVSRFLTFARGIDRSATVCFMSIYISISQYITIYKYLLHHNVNIQ